MTSEFELLLRKDIIEILDGDIRFDAQPGSIWGMPYLKGVDLCRMSQEFGLNQESGLSRWMYLENLLRYVIDTKRCEELLAYMFDIRRFDQLRGLGSQKEVDEAYDKICNTAIDRINAILTVDRHILKRMGNQFFIVAVGQKIEIKTANIDKIDTSYVRELPDRCKEELLLGNFDSVITKSRTMIEEVLVYILEKNNQHITTKGDLGKLFNQVKTLYNMQQNKDFDGRVNSLLSGLERIVEAIGSMRNTNSDAHGVGSRRISIKEREARLAMNSAMTFCEYILSIRELSL